MFPMYSRAPTDHMLHYNAQGELNKKKTHVFFFGISMRLPVVNEIINKMASHFLLHSFMIFLYFDSISCLLLFKLSQQ